MGRADRGGAVVTPRAGDRLEPSARSGARSGVRAGVLWLSLALSGWLPHRAAAQEPLAPLDANAGTLAEVRAELEAYYRDLSARDWTAFADHFWEGATLTTAFQPPGEEAVRVVATTVPEFVRLAPQGPGSREIFEEWIESAEIREENGLAQAWVRYGARFGDPGDVAEWRGIDAFTLLRHDGRWRISSLAYVAEP